MGPLPRAVPGHFLTLNPAFLIDLMIGHKTLACQAPTEGCWGNTLQRIQSLKCYLQVWIGTGWDDTEVHCLITSWQRLLLTWELYKHSRYTKYHQGLPSIYKYYRRTDPFLAVHAVSSQAHIARAQGV